MKGKVTSFSTTDTLNDVEVDVVEQFCFVLCLGSNHFHEDDVRKIYVISVPANLQHSGYFSQNRNSTRKSVCRTAFHNSLRSDQLRTNGSNAADTGIPRHYLGWW